MSIKHCPECGLAYLEQRHNSSFFDCPMCESRWVIVNALAVNRPYQTPTLYGALGTFGVDDVVAPVKLNTIDKGVSL